MTEYLLTGRIKLLLEPGTRQNDFDRIAKKLAQMDLIIKPDELRTMIPAGQIVKEIRYKFKEDYTLTPNGYYI